MAEAKHREVFKKKIREKNDGPTPGQRKLYFSVKKKNKRKKKVPQYY